MKKIIYGWGRNKKILSNIHFPKNINKVSKILSSKHKIIPRGNGRSYGDSSLQENLIISSLKLNKILSFNKTKGIIKVESGIILKDLLEYIIPQGWFIPVSPGTKYVTLGGMIASNVHGKNQHLSGCFINFVNKIKIITSKKKEINVSITKNKNLFLSTFGGMGLTGFITEIEIKLIKIKNEKIYQKIHIYNNLNQLLDAMKKNNNLYTVSWIDLFSLNGKKINSIMYSGKHIEKKEKLKNFKFSNNYFINKHIFKFLNFFLNDFIVYIFNKLKFTYSRIFEKKVKIIPLEAFFYPLDKIKNWNLIYGEKGFIQYQFVVPYKSASIVIKKILKILKKNDLIPYLAVLKTMKKDIGFLSFSMNGVSLALDIPVKKNLNNIISKLDQIIVSNNGKIYLTKDSYLEDKNFKNMYKNFNKFNKIRKIYKLNRYQSIQSKRLGI